jgi:hypothetical protein
MRTFPQWAATAQSGTEVSVNAFGKWFMRTNAALMIFSGVTTVVLSGRSAGQALDRGDYTLRSSTGLEVLQVAHQ